MTKRMSMVLPARVEKIIMPVSPSDPENVQINIQEGAGPFHGEIRIENCLTGEEGLAVKLKEGAHVTVRIEAAPLPK